MIILNVEAFQPHSFLCTSSYLEYACMLRLFGSSSLQIGNNFLQTREAPLSFFPFSPVAADSSITIYLIDHILGLWYRKNHVCKKKTDLLGHFHVCMKLYCVLNKQPFYILKTNIDMIKIPSLLFLNKKGKKTLVPTMC